MALPSSGVMKASMIRAELKQTGPWSINAPASRNLAKVPSGTIRFSDFYGKSAINYKILLDTNLTIGTNTSYGTGEKIISYGYDAIYHDKNNPPFGKLENKKMSNGVSIECIACNTQDGIMHPIYIDLTTNAPDNFKDFIFEIYGIEEVPVRRFGFTYICLTQEALKVFDFSKNVGKTVRIRIKQIVN